MKKYIFFSFFILFLLFNSIYNKFINLEIKEGKNLYDLEQQNTFKLTAKDTGYYLILFNDTVTITDATGNLGMDVNFIKGNYTTIGYYQGFKKGNYFQFSYSVHYSTKLLIKITKFNTDMRIRILDRGNPAETLFFDNCEKSIYLIIHNYANGMNKPLYFTTMIHSGQYWGYYKKTDFLKENEKFTDNFQHLGVINADELPNTNDINIVELKCKYPGVITAFEYMYQKNIIVSLDNKGMVHNIIKNSYSDAIFPEENIKYYYIQFYHVSEYAKIDMTNIDGKTYSVQHFHTSFQSDGTPYGKQFYISPNRLDFYWFMTVINNSGQNIGTVLSTEKTEYAIKDNVRMIIPISRNSDKKNIKIKSSLKRMFWSLEFTLINDYKYIPFPFGYQLKYENSDVLYIKNPYAFDERRGNYYYYIILYHYNVGQNPIFSYEYTDEEKKIEELKDDDNDDNNSSFASKPAFWIILFLIILLLGAGGFFYYQYYRKNNNSSLERLVNDEKIN